MTSFEYPNENYQQALGIQPGADVACSIYWKRGPGHNGTARGKVHLTNGVSNTHNTGNVVPPAEWERVELTITTDGESTGTNIYLTVDLDEQNQAVLFYGAQLESGIASSPYRANAATAGGLVASWADQSGNGYDITEATQAEMPLVLANSLDGYAGAVFDGVDDLLQELTGSLAYSQPFAFYLLLDISTIPPSAFPAKFMDWPTGVDSAVISFSTGKWAVNAGSWVYEEAATTGPVVIEGIFNGASSKLSQNFGTQATVNPGSAACSGNLIVGPVNVGGDETILYEAIVTNTAPSAVERAKLAAYFAFKYPSLGI
jgi:hypothetical protein